MKNVSKNAKLKSKLNKRPKKNQKVKIHSNSLITKTEIKIKNMEETKPESKATRKNMYRSMQRKNDSLNEILFGCKYFCVYLNNCF